MCSFYKSSISSIFSFRPYYEWILSYYKYFNTHFPRPLAEPDENINHNQTIDTKDLHYIVWLRNLEQETYFPVPAEKGRNDVRPREKEQINSEYSKLKKLYGS